MNRDSADFGVPTDSVKTVDAIYSPAPMTPRVIGPLDLAPVEFRQGLSRRVENKKTLVESISSLLRDGTDYGSVPMRNNRVSKPSLRKPGAEKICNWLGVVARFPALHEYELLAQQGKLPPVIIIRCELTNTDGVVVGEGGGARALAQDYDDMNKSLKMALKSSMIDAVIRSFGLSELFTQDLEDLPAGTVLDDGHEPAAEPTAEIARAPASNRPPETPPARTGASHGLSRPPASNARTISDKQAKLLWVRLDQAGCPEGEFLRVWNLASLDSLPANQMNEALSWIQNLNT